MSELRKQWQIEQDGAQTSETVLMAWVSDELAQKPRGEHFPEQKKYKRSGKHGLKK